MPASVPALGKLGLTWGSAKGWNEDAALNSGPLLLGGGSLLTALELTHLSSLFCEMD